MKIVVEVGQGKAEAGIGHHAISVTAVDLIAGEARLGTEVLPSFTALPAHSTCPAKPGDSNSHTRRETFDTRPAGQDARHDLVAWNQRQPRLVKFTVNHVQISPTNRTRKYTRQDLTWPGGAIGQRAGGERLPGLLENHREQVVIPSKSGNSPAVPGPWPALVNYRRSIAIAFLEMHDIAIGVPCRMRHQGQGDDQTNHPWHHAERYQENNQRRP